MTLSDPVLLATLGGIGTGFLLLIRWLKEDRDYWRDAFMRLLESTEVTAEVAAEKADPKQLSPRAAEAAQRIVRRTRRGPTATDDDAHA